MKTWIKKHIYKRKGRIVHSHSQRYLNKKEKSVIGKQKRAKGLRFEFKILNKIKKQYPDTSFRSAGSHSLIDVLVREPDKYRIIVARTKGYITPKEKEELKVFDKPYEQVELWSRSSPKTIKKEYLKRAGEKRFVKMVEVKERNNQGYFDLR